MENFVGQIMSGSENPEKKFLIILQNEYGEAVGVHPETMEDFTFLKFCEEGNGLRMYKIVDDDEIGEMAERLINNSNTISEFFGKDLDPLLAEMVAFYSKIWTLHLAEIIEKMEEKKKGEKEVVDALARLAKTAADAREELRKKSDANNK